MGVPLNQWIHVVFTRSLTSGMRIYVDGQEHFEQSYLLVLWEAVSYSTLGNKGNYLKSSSPK